MYRKFLFARVVKSRQLKLYEFKGKQCKQKCERKWCMDCCVKEIIATVGGKRGRLEKAKYYKGVTKCDKCDKVGRMVNSLTGFNLTRFLDEKDIQITFNTK